jgi:hypothetical protein
MGRVSLTDDVLGSDEVPLPVVPTSPVPVAPPLDERPRKFTMLVDTADDDRARRLTDAVVRLAGIRATKGMRADVVRALISLAADDDELQLRVARQLRDGMMV